MSFFFLNVICQRAAKMRFSCNHFQVSTELFNFTTCIFTTFNFEYVSAHVLIDLVKLLGCLHPQWYRQFLAIVIWRGCSFWAKIYIPQTNLRKFEIARSRCLYVRIARVFSSPPVLMCLPVCALSLVRMPTFACASVVRVCASLSACQICCLSSCT